MYFYTRCLGVEIDSELKWSKHGVWALKSIANSSGANMFLISINHLYRNSIFWSHTLHALHSLALGKVPFRLVAVFAYVASYTISLFRNITPSRPHFFYREKDSHNTGNYSLRIVCGFFNVPRWNFKHGRYCEMGPTVCSPYPKRLDLLM